MLSILGILAWLIIIQPLTCVLAKWQRDTSQTSIAIPLSRDANGRYAVSVNMVRLVLSSSNL
jgi:hypothetical protein